MIEVDKTTGSNLMRAWGVSKWPDTDAKYYIWNGCGVFALIDKVDFVDLHLAMRKGSRHKSRDMVSDSLSLTDKPVRAMIAKEHMHVCNLAEKMGFKFTNIYAGRYPDGTETEVIEMMLMNTNRRAE